MPTDVEIGNMALGKLGTRATIASLTEDSVEAREINRVYTTVRDDLLAAMDWNFARVYLDLALSGTAPTKWSFSYAYPSDCLKFWGFDIGSPLPFPLGLCTTFEVGSDGTDQLIWCDLDQATGVYTQRVTNSMRFDPRFTAAFIVRLAATVALPITQKMDVAQALKLEAESLTERAEVKSANEAVTNERERVAETISVRGYDGYTGAWGPWPWWSR